MSYKTHVICKRCNNNWLGGWEGKLKPILCPLIGGRPRELTPATLAEIAAWLFKTALLIPYGIPNPIPWPERYYHAFYDSNKQVPADALIWIGAYTGGGDPIWAYANILNVANRGKPGSDREGHMVTFYVGHLLAKIELVPDNDLGAAAKPQASGAAFRIWPQPDNPEGLLWPTPAFTLEQIREEARSITLP